MSEPNPPRGSSRGRRRTTYRLAVCSVFCALGTVMLGLGALVELIDITCAALAAVLFLPVFYRYGTGYTLLCWAVTSALGLILMPQSLAPWLFACLLGYYPVVKRQVDRLPKPACTALQAVHHRRGTGCLPRPVLAHHDGSQRQSDGRTVPRLRRGRHIRRPDMGHGRAVHPHLLPL